MLANNNTNNHTETSSSTATAGATTATAIAAKFGRISVVVTHHSKSILYSFDKLKTLPDSIQDICLNHFKLKNYKEYCLRTDCRTVPLEDDLLLNDDNYRRRIDNGSSGMVALKLVPSPEKLCRDMIEELSSSDHQTSTSSSTTDMKKLMFTLQYAVREQEYYSVFLKLEGLAHLARIILESQGNTLAYALTALSNIMDHDYGWDQFSPEFIGNIVSIISSAHQRANICRPATSVVTKFISSNTNIKSYGFDCVYDQIKRHPEFLKTLVNRIQSVADADYSVQSHSLDLINVLIRNCGILSRQDILYTLDSLNLRQACLTQLQRRGPVVQELSKQLLEFQCLLVTEFHNRKNRTVSSGSGSITSERHEDMIRFIWSASGMTVNGPLKWRKMGFATENVKREFDKVGVLGLELVQTFVERNTDLFIKMVQVDDDHLFDEKRCPFGRSAMECIDILVDYMEISTGFCTSTHPEYLFFEMDQVFVTLIKCFNKLWVEMDAVSGGEDLMRVSSVVRFLLENTALRSSFSYASSDEFNYGNQNPLTNFQKHLLETPYSTVRAKIVQQLDRQDDTLNSNRIVRNMREKLYREHYDFMKQQRLECLHRGAWFHSSSGSGSISGTAAPGKRTSHYNWKLRSSNGAASWFRFYRVGVNNKSLHYGDFKDVANFDALPAITDLPERGKTKLNDEEIDRSILIDPTPTLTLVDISSLVDVFEHAAPSSHAAEYSTPRPTHFLTSAANLFSKQSSTTELSLTFSLVSSSSLSTTTSDTTASSRSSSTTLLSPTSASANTAFNNSHSAAVLAEFSCLNQVQFSEWTDGFRILANKPIGHSITRSLVDDLTDISLKLSLLDFTGNEIDLANATRILESLDQELPSLPNCDFVYSAASDSFLFSRIDADKSRANDVGADFGKGVRRNVLRVKRKPIKSVLPSTILLNGTQLEEDELYSPHLSEDDEIDGEEEEEEEDQQEDEEEEEE